MKQPTPSGTAKIVSLEVPGPAGSLEAVVNEPASGSPAFVALVCHPHPSYGGTLHNKVVHRVAAALTRRGGAVLRFNFRGVGQSAGTFDEGEGELDDARAALQFLIARYPRSGSRWVAGFSFGAWVAARLAASETRVDPAVPGGVLPGVERLILIAPPVTRSDFQVLRASPVPKLVIQGTRDEVCPPAALEAEFARWAEPKKLVLVEGASHFFDRQLADLDAALAEGLAELFPPREEPPKGKPARPKPPPRPAAPQAPTDAPPV